MTSYKIMNIELEPAPQMSGKLSKFAVERCVFIIELWNEEIYGWLPFIGSTFGNSSPRALDLVTDKNLNNTVSLCNMRQKSFLKFYI